jgi:alkyl hydroperoxide reductase subunit AhpF
MTIIAEKDRETIQAMLASELVDDVELLLFTRPRSRVYLPGRQDCETCEETRELLEELVGLSEKLHLTTHDVSLEPDAADAYRVTEVPTVLVRRAQSESAPAEKPPAPPNVRFLGLPAGYEFSTLLADVVDMSKGSTDLSEPGREEVRAIDTPVHIQVFVTPT